MAARHRLAAILRDARILRQVLRSALLGMRSAAIAGRGLVSVAVNRIVNAPSGREDE
jgi:hypothetical protein